MSLNNISLSSQLIADLYQNVLIQGHTRAMPASKTVPILGKNAKNILVIVDKKDAPFLPDNELSFLTNILSACQLGLTDVGIVNWQKIEPQTSSTLFEQVEGKQVILFGTRLSEFGIPDNTQHYTIIKNDARQFVVAPSLTEIENNKEAKKQLWMALKQLFGI